ncbi:uncharacterized protein DMAD_07843 [Drosophila madeirensis]|uniref:Uncharacterized protein n=1 Tax=Drosophila madeirensis TaxID=30013 RepID=A0AAU9F0G8_DROMD
MAKPGDRSRYYPWLPFESPEPRLLVPRCHFQAAAFQRKPPIYHRRTTHCNLSEQQQQQQQQQQQGKLP